MHAWIDGCGIERGRRRKGMCKRAIERIRDEKKKCRMVRGGSRNEERPGSIDAESKRKQRRLGGRRNTENEM